MGIYENTTALRQEKLPVIYKNLPGTIHLSGKDYVTLVFKSVAMEPLILTNYELEQSFDSDLFVTTDKQSSNAHLQLTPEKTFEISRTGKYLKKLYDLGGRKYFVGGDIIRERAIALVAKELSDDNPPSPATLANWVAEDRDRVGGKIAKIAESVKRCRKSKFNDEMKLRVIEFADDRYFGQSRPFQTFYNDFVDSLADEEIKGPSRETIRGWINEVIDPKLLHKNLSRAERKKLRRNAVKKFQVSRPLERVEADGATIAIGLIDDENNYLGGFTIIFLIDVFTRCIVGYEIHIGSGEPASTVISAFRHAICPKAEGSYSSQANNKWFCYGVPELLVVDGGSGFISIETHSYALKTTGVEIEVLPSYSPFLKPFIERFIGNFRKKCVVEIAGHVGKLEVHKKLEYTMKERAIHTIDEVRRFIEMWIVDDYHHTPHSGLNGKTPAQKWQVALDNKWVPTVPVDNDKVMLPAGKTKQATISGDACHLGVTINRVRYNDEDGRLKGIGLWLKQQNRTPKITCMYSDDDLSAITAVCPINGDEFKVTTTSDDVYQGMSVAEFAAKNPSSYKNKGKTKSTTFTKNPAVQAGKAAEADILNKSKSAKTRAASPEDIEKAMENMDSGNPQVNDANPYDDTDTDLGEVAPLPQS